MKLSEQGRRNEVLSEELEVMPQQGEKGRLCSRLSAQNDLLRDLRSH